MQRHACRQALDLDETIVGAGDEEEGVAGGVVDAPDAFVVRLVLVHGRLGVHIPQRHAALVVTADDVAAHIPGTAHTHPTSVDCSQLHSCRCSQ